ncbi:hypothetical protein MCOR19_009394 [Pyricularia oryzae]|nr:hypothetical protein MCOR19_009394 [Pyricularia oryzae]KAI6449757.1 hypothetical protein MCOR15_009622 [Pyricularia oryzae]KAI6475759.1 hypothetical protein MCOR18_007281 [Pyricularia oryzae]KAI6520164.1 hypothetical protein MCOR16_008360 [Pyricularia oryzae]KAI6581156.1 hypothetical protein MCOR06_009192 [Pyricularia oryzae]
MASCKLMKVISVGGNPVSAFLSWRLQATNACDVTLVWKSGFEHISQYGILFRSPVFGNERFKPRHVVKSPEEAAMRKDGVFDYVILCIKALPDAYDLAAIIDSVVTPQHTCILINTIHILGVEAAIEKRFSTNVLLLFVLGAELTQLGASEFEHKGSTEVWVGPVNSIGNIPTTTQEDMAQALAITLNSGQINCKVSSNIRQQQYERIIGPIAFHPASVIFETLDHTTLLEKVGVHQMISEIIDELLVLASAQGCKMPKDCKQKIMTDMTQAQGPANIMWQDFTAKRPMEVETYLGSPIRLAAGTGVSMPRIQTLYAILHNINMANQNKPKFEPAPKCITGSPGPSPSPIPTSIVGQNGPPRPIPNGMSNGHAARPRGSFGMGSHGMGPLGMGSPPGMRQPPQPMNGGSQNGYERPPMSDGPYGYPGLSTTSKGGSMEDAHLEEFRHLVVYDNIPESAKANYIPDAHELAIRERNLALREQKMRMRRGPGPRYGPPTTSVRNRGLYDDENEDEDYFDPSGAPFPRIGPKNFDMISVTSKKNRKAAPPNPTQFRKNPEFDQGPPSRIGRFRPSFGRNRHNRIGQPTIINENFLDDPLTSCSSNRYGAVDRTTINAELHTNSLIVSRIKDMRLGFGGGPPPMGINGAFRRSSQLPGSRYSPSIPGGNSIPSPPSGHGGPPVIINGGQPSSPDGMR